MERAQSMECIEGIELYKSWMKKGVPLVKTIGGDKKLFIYRGMKWDQRVERPSVNLAEPGEDWTPIQAYAEEYAIPSSRDCLLSNAKQMGQLDHPWTKWVEENYDPDKTPWILLSARVSMNFQSVLESTIEDQKTLPEEVWGDYHQREIFSLVDALMIRVLPQDYSCLEDVLNIGSNKNRPILVGDDKGLKKF